MKIVQKSLILYKYNVIIKKEKFVKYHTLQQGYCFRENTHERKNSVARHYTITYKFRIYIKHVDFLKRSQKLYNEIILIYYELLLENQNLLKLSNQYWLRKLEKLTGINRAGERFKDKRRILKIRN